MAPVAFGHALHLGHPNPYGGSCMNSFRSFDGTRIAYHDQGEGPVVILLHGYGLDGLGHFGHFDHSRPILEKTLSLFQQEMGFAPPMPDPPIEGRPGLIERLLAAGARVIVPDMRGFGASDKPYDTAAYADSAMARDVAALIDHLGLDAVDVLGFSMGSVTATKLLALGISQVKSAILVGVADYILEGEAMQLPKNWPLPDHLPKPLTMRAYSEEGANILDRGEIDRGNLMTAQVILVRATGADPKVLAAVLRGAMAEQVPPEALRKVDVPVLLLNGKTDIANQAIERLLEVIPTAHSATCDGDHGSTPFQPSFQQSVTDFFELQWTARRSKLAGAVI
jgi:pimeloyl-ACP methyl ester carboxylesterase